jgi:very-short-patch-repair endonuclease
MRTQRSSGSRPPLEIAVAGLAQRQHGIVARGQLLGLGMSADQIGRRLRRGYLHPVHRGVYAVGHRFLAREGRWLAAVLACGSGSVLSHRSAGALWGVVSPSQMPVDVTRAGSGRRRRGICLHRSPLRSDESCALIGIPLTGVSRTILDLAAVLPRGRVERALNEVEVLGLTDRISIPSLLERYPRRRGTAMLRDLLADSGTIRGVTKRELEARFKAVLDSTDLPRPRLNASVAVGGRFYEVDCLWARERLIVELDGRLTHGTARAFERDRARDRALLGDGWRVVRITWRQLHREAPTLLSDLRKLLHPTSLPPTL